MEINSFLLNFLSKGIKNSQKIENIADVAEDAQSITKLYEVNFKDVQDEFLSNIGLEDESNPAWNLFCPKQVQRRVDLANKDQIQTKLASFQIAEQVQSKEIIQKVTEIGKKLKLESKYEKATLGILLGSADPEEACSQIYKLNTKRKEKKQIMNVIIQTSLMEKSYNTFYCKILQKLGFLSQDFTQNLYGAIFDILLGPVNKYSAKKLTKFSKMLSDCLIMGIVNTKLFKFMQVSNLNNTTLQIGKLIVKQIFQRLSKEEVRTMAFKIAKNPHNADVCEHLRNITMLIQKKESEYSTKMLEQGLGQHVVNRFTENAAGFKKWIKHQLITDGENGGEYQEDEEPTYD